MSENRRQDSFSERQKLTISLLLAAIALVSISAASYAWFTIADFTKVYSMSMEVTSGSNLRFDLDGHSEFEEYVKTLAFEQIAERIRREKGFDMQQVPLKPVTTTDCGSFALEDGTFVAADSGAYLSFRLHFMATEDMIVHLTSANSEAGKDGTAVTSSNQKLPDAMRIAFVTDGTCFIYDPGSGPEAQVNGDVRTFGLLPADEMVLSQDNALFALKKGIDKPVDVYIWLEGSDPSCTDAIRKADYQIKLRFIGTDEKHNVLDGSNH